MTSAVGASRGLVKFQFSKIAHFMICTQYISHDILCGNFMTRR